MKFGPWVRESRRRRGLNLVTLASRLGCSKGYLSGIETGKVHPPRDAWVRKLAGLLHLDEDELRVRAYLEKSPASLRRELARRWARSGDPRDLSAPPPHGGIPLLNTKGQGYPGRLDADGLPARLCAEAILIPGVPPDTLFALTVCGNELAGFEREGLHSGDIALLSRTIPAKSGDLAFALAERKRRGTGVLCRVSIQEDGAVVLQTSRPADPFLRIRPGQIWKLFPVVGRIVFLKHPQGKRSPDEGVRIPGEN